jgi:hypothetical protein
MTDTTIEGIPREVTALTGAEYLEGQDATGSFKVKSSNIVSNYLPLTGGTVTGPTSFTDNNAPLTIHPAAAGSSAVLSLSSALPAANVIYGWANGNPRWSILPGDGEAESGSNAGSNFLITRYADGGVAIGNVLTINRATGDATFGGNVTASGSVTAGGLLTQGSNAALGAYSRSGSGALAFFYNQTGVDARINLSPGGDLAAFSTSGLNLLQGAYQVNGAPLAFTNIAGHVAPAQMPAGAHGQGFGSPVKPASQTFTMQGLALTFTPTRSGVVQFQISGTVNYLSGAAAGDGIQYYLAYGTGTPPVNGAASTGTAPAYGNIQNCQLGAGGTWKFPFSYPIMVYGLTVGTPYWFDLIAAQLSANPNAVFYECWGTAMEQ